MISKSAVLKFQQKFQKSTEKKDSIKLSKSSVDYLAGVAPKPKISKKKVIKIPKKKLMNIPKYKKKQLKDIPKFEKIELPAPKPVVVSSYLKEVEVPKVEFHEIDPWSKVVELIAKCSKAVLKKNLDFAEIYYVQMHPFYDKLSDNDKRHVYFKVQELHESIIRLRMDKVKEIITS